MSKDHKVSIKIPNRIYSTTVMRFIHVLRSAIHGKDYVIDFIDFRFIDPFSILILSSELADFKEHHSVFQPVQFINYQHEGCGYLSHIGFFHSFGIEWGNKVGTISGNKNFIPLQIIDVAKIKADAFSQKVNAGELLTNVASKIAKLLTNEAGDILHTYLTYTMREMFRNVAEHSEASQLGICGQRWPSKNLVSFAIYDRGIGLKKSLEQNPNLTLSDDKNAIEMALKPGISSKVYPGLKRKPKGEWVNSGYGLHLVSELCREFGSFSVLSGKAHLFLNYQKKNTYQNEHDIYGTALNIQFNTLSLPILSLKLNQLNGNVSTKSPASSKSISL